MDSVNSRKPLLRRRNYSREEVIQQNLQTMRMRSSGKKVAQQKYYGFCTQPENQNKLPVHARLGMQRINLRRGAFSYRNNEFVQNRLPPKRRFIRNRGGIINPNRLRLIRNQDSNRLRLIRNQEGIINPNRLRFIRNREGNINPNRLRFLRNREGIVNPNRLRLRRIHDNPRPIDYTVQIPFAKDRNNFRHSCLRELTHQLQQEIGVIQAEGEKSSPEEIPPIPIYVNGFGYTAISLTQRFSL